MIKNAAIITGMVIGSLTLLTVLIVYLRTQKFALGGSVLTVFGTILLGLSIWVNIEVSIGKNGVIEARFFQMESSIARAESKIQLQESKTKIEAKTSLSYGDPIEFKKFNPSIEEIKYAFEKTEKGQSFGVILSRPNLDQYYMQASKLGDSKLYTIEYRAGSSDQHYTYKLDLEKVLIAFESYLLDNENYKGMFEWEKLDF